MAKRCATLAEVLDQAPECRGFGDPSEGTVTFASNPSDGDTFTVVDNLWTWPAVSASLTARSVSPGGGEFLIGATPLETAANFASAVNNPDEPINGLIMASRAGTVVTLSTAAEGAESMFPITVSDPTSMVLSGATLTGGDAMVRFALDCACSFINLDWWKSKASCGHVYATAHLCTAANKGERGPVNAKSIDKISATYAAVGTATKLDAHFSTTHWGRMYLALRSTLLVMPLVGRGVMVPRCP